MVTKMVCRKRIQRDILTHGKRAREEAEKCLEKIIRLAQSLRKRLLLGLRHVAASLDTCLKEGRATQSNNTPVCGRV